MKKWAGSEALKARKAARKVAQVASKAIVDALRLREIPIATESVGQALKPLNNTFQP